MCRHGELLAVPRQWGTTLCMRAQGIGRKQWHGFCAGTMWKVVSGCEYEVGGGSARRDGSWMGVGVKSDVDWLWDAGVPWKHLECRRMWWRSQSLRFARGCQRGFAVPKEAYRRRSRAEKRHIDDVVVLKEACRRRDRAKRGI